MAAPLDAPAVPRADLVRQVVVLVGAVLAIGAAVVGSGATGGPSQPEIGDGALAPDATLVAPGRPAFAIWSVIYTGLVVWAVRQALPPRRTERVERSLGWLLLGSLVLNAAWITVVQVGLLGASVPVILLLLGVLVAMAVRLHALPDRSGWDRLVVDGTTGLYLGWVCVATVANVAAVLASAGWTELGLGATAWAVLVLVVAGAVGIGLARWAPGLVGASLAIAWGVAWIAVARALDQPRSGVVATTAAVVAAVVLAVGIGSAGATWRAGARAVGQR